MAVIDDHYKFVKNGNVKATPWELFDLQQDPGETNDLAAQQPDRLERMKAEALAIQTSIDASEQGKDYPEGKVLQPERSESWFEMEAYQALYDRFAELKPGWTAKKSIQKEKDR